MPVPRGRPGASYGVRRIVASPPDFYCLDRNEVRTREVRHGTDLGCLRSESRAALVRILVVDDNPAVRRYLRTILEQQGEWRVCGEARTGEETLQRVQDSIPDLILLDFQLPDQNGLEVAREIHRLRPATPILMVTIHMSNQLAAAAKSVGIRGICAKSDVGSIEEAVQTLLEEKTYFPRMTSLSQ